MSADPPRLVDDSATPDELAEDVRAMIDAEPPVLDVAAGLAALATAIDASPAGVGEPGATGSAASGATAGGAVAIAAGGVVVAILLAGLAFWALAPEPEAPAPPAPATEPRAADDAPIAPRVEPEPVEAPVVVAPTAEPPTEAEPEPAPRPRPRPSREAREAAAEAPAPSTTQDALREEMLVTSRARAALGADPARALSLAREGQRRFPSGLFAEEREAIEVLALAGLGRADEARGAGQRFLRAHPASPFAERVRRAIAGAPP